jgi:hypothetical protein
MLAFNKEYHPPVVIRCTSTGLRLNVHARLRLPLTISVAERRNRSIRAHHVLAFFRSSQNIVRCPCQRHDPGDEETNL